MPKGRRGGGINLDRKEEGSLRTWKETGTLLKLEGGRELKSDRLYLSFQIKGELFRWKLGVRGVHDDEKSDMYMDLFPGGIVCRNTSKISEMNVEEGKEK